MQPLPIETHYNGYRFRSRLEARWAVYFDTMGITYQHEPEGYNLGGIWYLPDFWLPQVNMFAEVKFTTFTEDELEKCILLAKATQWPCLLLDGPPDLRHYVAITPQYGMSYDTEWEPDPGIDVYVLDSHHLDEHRFYVCPGSDDDFDGGNASILRAVTAARSMRFGT